MMLSELMHGGDGLRISQQDAWGLLTYFMWSMAVKFQKLRSGSGAAVRSEEVGSMPELSLSIILASGTYRQAQASCGLLALLDR